MTNVTNEINRIYPESRLNIIPINNATMLFNNGKIISKTRYSVIDGYINVLDQVENNLTFLYNSETYEAEVLKNSKILYYEFCINLTNGNTTIKGKDRFNNELKLPLSASTIIFINGLRISQNDYEVNCYTNEILIKGAYTSEKISNVIIISSEFIEYRGIINNPDNPNWNPETKTLTFPDYNLDRFIFFYKGKLIEKSNLNFDGYQSLYINVPIFSTNDKIICYKIPSETLILNFKATPGYFSFGPIDDSGLNVPTLYDTIVNFEKPVKYVIDDIRPGFFIKEKNSNGCLVVIDKEYETTELKCTKLIPFSKPFYQYKDWFIQVPEAKSILKYVSEFDLKGKLLPELLGIFQKTLLNETYDSIQRLKNIRSLYNVDSVNINNLINFMGLKINIIDMTLERRHAILEEINNFYKQVGTRESYNFYNLMSDEAQLLDIIPLYTPSYDYLDEEMGNMNYRYVTFKTPEELGAVEHTEYRIPYVDYGFVDEIANIDDYLTNTSPQCIRSSGTLQNPNKKYSPDGKRTVYPQLGYTNGDLTQRIIYEDQEIGINDYLENKEPNRGPNRPTIDYGYLPNPGEENEVDNIIDNGLVKDKIKGKWVNWREWDRSKCKNWYQTNHVKVKVKIPPKMTYAEFMHFFKDTFYNIASAVVYIHSLTQVYSFGTSVNIDIASSQIFHSILYTMTADPDRFFDYNPLYPYLEDGRRIQETVNNIEDIINERISDSDQYNETITDN